MQSKNVLVHQYPLLVYHHEYAHTTAISMIQSIINDHKREKREQGNDKRDLEYHEKRMKDSK